MSRKQKKKKGIVKYVVLLGTSLFIISIFVFSIFHFFVKEEIETKDYYQPESRYQQASSTSVEDSVTLGWIMVQGTNIDYPVVYETNSVYNGLRDYTWVSNYYAEGENRMTIFGHNVLNVSNKPLIGNSEHTRFEQLMAFVYEDFAKENLYIQYSHDGADDLYKIYAVSFEEFDEDMGESFSSLDELTEYVNGVRKNSIYDYDVDVSNKDQLITLSTCTRFFGLDGKQTFKIDARKVRDNEKNDKYNVQKNKNYDILNLE